MHTFVPDEIGGRGIASKLASTALQYAKDQGHKIAVLCPFVAAYVKKHPEWYALYDKEYHQNIPAGRWEGDFGKAFNLKKNPEHLVEIPLGSSL